MKKALVLLLTVLCVVCVVTLLCACNENHTMGEWIEATPATCTQAGTVGHFHCTHCDKNFDKEGNEIADINIEQLGHDPVAVHATPATCTEDGYSEGTKCDRCGVLLTAQKTEKALGHQPTVVVGTPATCTEDGLSDCYQCLRCNKFSLTAEGEFDGNDKEDVQTKIDATGHSYGPVEIVKGATCTEAGEQKRVCVKCEHEDITSIDKVSHLGLLVAGTPATCTVAGTTDCWQCTMCGKYSETETGDYAITSLADAQRIVPASGHNYDGKEWQVVEPSTCQVAGQQARTCNNCEYTEVAELPLKEHSFDNWTVVKPATCTNEGEEERVCTTCDPQAGTPYKETRSTSIDSTAHAIENVAGKPATCTEAGLSDGQVCSLCGKHLVEQTAVSALGHKGEFTYSHVADANFEHHIKRCEREDCPGEDEQCTITVTDDRDNCEAPGTSTRTCEFCKNQTVTELAAGSHSWDNGTITTPAQCDKDGVITYKCQHCDQTKTGPVDVRPAHQPDGEWHADALRGVHYQLCTVCQTELMPEEHQLSQSYIKDETSHWYECLVCRERVGEQTHEKQVLEAVQPDCENSGLTQGAKCAVCEYQIEAQKTVEALGHNYGAWQADDERVGEHKQVCQNDPEHVQWKACSYNTQVVEATCTTEGYELHTCTECGDTVTLNRQDALGHSYGNWVSVIVDEQDTAHTHIHYADCTRCHAEEARKTDNCTLELRQSFDPTCTTAGYDVKVCKDCQAVHEEVTAPASGHTIEYDHRLKGSPLLCEHCPYCTVCDYRGDYEDCTPTVTVTQATCTEPRKSNYVCAVCHEGRTIPHAEQPLGHLWGQPQFSGTADDPKHTVRCLREGCEEEITTPCDVVEVKNLPTCVEAGNIERACKVCLSVIYQGQIESVGHDWSSWTFENGIQHVQVCNKCNERAYGEHNYEVVSKVESNCEQQGKTIEQCRECNNRVEHIDSEVSMHSWTLVSVTATGHKRQCVNCQLEEETSHDWSNSNLCSVCNFDGLIYKIEGNHCIVSDDRLVSKAKNIVINANHRELGEDGNYLPTEYPVKEIGEDAFFNNSAMETLTIPSCLERIGEMAFYYCTGLRTVTVDGDGEALKRIESRAFSNCGALISFIPPKSIVYVGDYAFLNCTSLSQIEIGDQLEEIGKSAFLNTAFVNDPSHWTEDVLYIGKHLIKAHQAQQADGTYSNTDVTVREGTVSISAEAFSDCTTLQRIVLPKSLKTVDADAFKNCTQIANVEYQGDFAGWLSIYFHNDYSSPLHYGNPSFHIDLAHDNIDVPEGVTRIPAGTFRGTNIKSVTLPSTLTYIGEEAFENCGQLTQITLKSDVVSYVGANAFYNSAYYLDDENWHMDAVLYVGSCLIEARKNISGSYTVQSGTVVIAKDAFKNCKQLTEIVLNKELMNVGAGAFVGCDGLTTIRFTETGYRWFMNGEIIGRALMVTDTRWQNYKLYVGSWSRYSDPIA